jgi:hypothetical protein
LKKLKILTCIFFSGNASFYDFYHTVAAAYFLGYLAAHFLGNVYGGKNFEMRWRQILQPNEAAELTFTVKRDIFPRNSLIKRYCGI